MSAYSVAVCFWPTISSIAIIELSCCLESLFLSAVSDWDNLEMARTEEMNEILRNIDLKDRKMLEYYSSQQVEHLEKLAEHYAEVGEWRKAEAALRRSLQILIPSIGPDAPQVSVILQLLAQLLHAQPDRQEEAVPLARESLLIREKAFGKDHISVGKFLMNRSIGFECEIVFMHCLPLLSTVETNALIIDYLVARNRMYS